MNKQIITSNGKYKFLSKLGSGRFSTCWEAEQIGGKKKESSNVAIKVQKNKKDNVERANQEIQLFTILNNSVEKCDNVVELQDSFIEKGGDVCMVFNKMDKTLLELIEESEDGLPLHIVKDISRQLLKGLAFLRKNGIIHADLKPENILVKEIKGDTINYQACIADLGSACLYNDIEQYNNLEEHDDIIEYIDLLEDYKVNRYIQLISDEGTLSETEKKVLKRLKNEENVKKYIELMENENVKEYIRLENIVSRNVGTTEYRSLEHVIDADYDFSTDIWSVACIIFECLTNNYLFDPSSFCKNDEEEEEDSSSSDDDDDESSSSSESNEEHQLLVDQMQLWLMTRTLGDIPRYISRKGQFADDFFHRAGNIKNMPQFLKEKTISYTLRYDYNIDEGTAKKIEDFLLPMLTYDANKRISPSNALNHPFLSD